MKVLVKRKKEMLSQFLQSKRNIFKLPNETFVKLKLATVMVNAETSDSTSQHKVLRRDI